VARPFGDPGRGWVESARMKRVALTHPRERKQAASKGAVRLEACHGITRARGFEAANAPQHARERALVHANQEDEHVSQHRLRALGPAAGALGSACATLHVAAGLQSLGGAMAQDFLHGEPLGANLPRAERGRSRPSDDHQVHPRRKQVRPRPEALAAHPLDSIALHGGAYLAAYHEADPGKGGFGLGVGLPCDQESEMRRGHPASCSLRSNELGMPAKPAILPEREGRHRTIQASGRTSGARRRSYFL
jgi:hypothetical protein